jgi:branched-chain amino acid transport system substrate-binding protein
MKGSSKVLIVVVLVAIIVAGAVYEFYPFWRAPSTETIKLGFIAEITGSAAQLVSEGLRGAQLAVEQINSKGGLSVGGKQYRVELVTFDNQYTVELSQTGAEKLITSDKVLMLLGTDWTPAALTVAKVAEQRKTPFIVTMAAAAGLGDMIQKNNWRYSFQVSQSATAIATGLAATLVNIIKAKSVAIVGQDSDFGKGAAAPFVEYVKKNSPSTEILDVQYTPAGTSNFSTVLAKFKTLNPSVIYECLGGVEQQTFALQKYDAGLRMPLLSAGGATSSQKYIDTVGNKAEYQVVNLAWAPKPITALTMPFVQSYRDKFGNLAVSQASAFTYDSFLTAFDAIQRAGKLDKEVITDALLQTNLTGVSGPITFDPTTHIRPYVPLIGQIQGGKFVTIYPLEVKDGTYAQPPS